MKDFAASIPVLRSFDKVAARAFYVEFLEFDKIFWHRFDLGAPLYLGVRCGDCVLHLSGNKLTFCTPVVRD